MHDSFASPLARTATPARAAEFVAIHYSTCDADYRARFEQLFKSRAHAIDNAVGFQKMPVLKPDLADGPYMVVSYWGDRASFDYRRTSPEFAEGHRRGFAEVAAARAAGRKAPMSSRMETLSVLCA